MVKLNVVYYSVAYMRTSNLLVTFHTDSKHRICAGYSVATIQALFKLFIEGKKVYGSVDNYHVDLSEEEADVFKMLSKVNITYKRKIWEDYLSGRETKKQLFERLKRELPIWILKQKIS